MSMNHNQGTGRRVADAGGLPTLLLLIAASVLDLYVRWSALPALDTQGRALLAAQACLTGFLLAAAIGLAATWLIDRADPACEPVVERIPPDAGGARYRDLVISLPTRLRR